MNIGVRWDYEKTPSYLNYVTPTEVVAAFGMQDPNNAPAGQTYAETLAKGGININNYISTGNNRHAQDNEFQPRFGFSYDINGDEAHVIHGGCRAFLRPRPVRITAARTNQACAVGAGHYFPESIPLVRTRARAAFRGIPPTTAVLGVLQTLLAGTTAGREVDMITNNVKTPYSDQVSLGMRNKVGDWNTDVTVARVNSFQGLVFQLGNRYPNGAFWENGSQPWG